MKEKAGVKEKQDIANIFGLSPASFSNKKRTGTLLLLIIEWAVNENINLDELIVGAKHKSGKIELDASTLHFTKYLAQALEVLKSEGPASSFIKQQIEATHKMMLDFKECPQEHAIYSTHESFLAHVAEEAPAGDNKPTGTDDKSGR